MKFLAAAALFGVVVNSLPQAEIAPRAAATYLNTIGSYKHFACQTDPNTNARTLTGKSMTSSSMTPKMCKAFCFGSTYFGVEWGVECYCGNSLASTSSAVAQSQCNKACPGKSAWTCGSNNRLDLYKLVATLSTSTSTSTTSSRSSTSTTTSRSSTSTTTSRSSTSTTTSSSSTTTTSTASPTPAANDGKRGLCYNDAALTSSFVGPNSQVSWGYNWGSWIDSSFPTAYEFVPMLWSNASDLTSIWFANVNSAIARGTTHVLSFNEPDLNTQANMSPKAAAEAYMKWMQPLAGRVKLGAPAITNGAAPMGLAWMSQFMGNCTACTIDFVPIHWYDQAFNYYYFKAYIQSVHAQIQKPIWITEFNGAGSQDDQSIFLKLVMPWLDSLAYIQRYAWFWAADGYLLSTGTTLSETGVTFNNYTSSTVNSYFTS